VGVYGDLRAHVYRAITNQKLRISRIEVVGDGGWEGEYFGYSPIPRNRGCWEERIDKSGQGKMRRTKLERCARIRCEHGQAKYSPFQPRRILSRWPRSIYSYANTCIGTLLQLMYLEAFCCRGLSERKNVMLLMMTIVRRGI
jgi:hypothetical protein